MEQIIIRRLKTSINWCNFSDIMYFTSNQFNSKMKVFVSLLLVAAAVSGAPSANHLGVLGGTDAKLGQFPYLVTLQNKGRNDDDLRRNSCGGLIINENSIVTAAHCLLPNRPRFKVYTVKAGIVDQNSKDFQEIEIKRGLLHPGFDVSRNDVGLPSFNDIALITLASNLTFNDNVKALALPAQDSDVEDGASGQFAGWGAYYNSSGYFVEPSVAQSINYTTLSYPECKAAYGDTTNYVNRLDEKLTLCVGSLVDNTGPVLTEGDEGAPFVVNGVPVGISSWYPQDFPPNSLRPAGGIFTKLSAYVDWINENLQ